jgi:hypothetical protein
VRRLGPAALVVAIIPVLAACGGTHHAAPTGTSQASSATGRLSIRPAVPTTASRISFTFTAPATAGRHGPSQLSFALTVAGPSHAGCVGPRTAPVPRAVKGQTASVVLGPHWCAGAYSARVQEFARPFCKPGQMCAQYIRLVGTVASTRFRVVPV